jgi:hypothetical protein
LPARRLQLTLEHGNGTMDETPQCAYWDVKHAEWVVDGEVRLQNPETGLFGED